jgi:hypothetical protein
MNHKFSVIYVPTAVALEWERIVSISLKRLLAEMASMLMDGHAENMTPTIGK